MRHFTPTCVEVGRRHGKSGRLESEWMIRNADARLTTRCLLWAAAFAVFRIAFIPVDWVMLRPSSITMADADVLRYYLIAAAAFALCGVLAPPRPLIATLTASVLFGAGLHFAIDYRLLEWAEVIVIALIGLVLARGLAAAFASHMR